MKPWYQLARTVMILATSFLLAACLTGDVDPESAAPGQAAYEESSKGLSQAEEVVPQTPAADKRIEAEWDPTCDDNCFPGACRACLTGCREDFDGQQEEDCLHACSFCGHPCFC
jgi:hypothetical protein